MSMASKLPIIITILLLCLSQHIHAEQVTIFQAKNKLQRLEKDMHIVQQSLIQANNNRSQLQKVLATTEKEISSNVRKLNLITQNIQAKQQQLAQLKTSIDTLTTTQTKQQLLLSKHLIAGYKIGEYQPLKLLLDQNSPHEINKLFTLYQYIIKSRTELINNLNQTKNMLDEKQTQLQQAITEQEKLTLDLRNNQEQLSTAKINNAAILQSLQKTILSKKDALKEYEQNKIALSELLRTLNITSSTQTPLSFAKMRRKLNRPVDSNQIQVERIQQGITFFAEEGALVKSIYPGTIVFSDWLKGYGLLIIIDHGANFMSLYAHNQSLFKRKGDLVKEGEQIAIVGHTGGCKKNSLYFEIRDRGKAVPPLEWLA